MTTAQLCLRETRIGDAIARRNLSQSDVARYLGVTQAAVSRWVSGGRTPRAEIAERLVLLLGLECRSRLVAEVGAIRFALETLRDFENAPDEIYIALIEEIAQRWPDHPIAVAQAALTYALGIQGAFD